VVIPDFARFVHDPFFEPRFGGIDDRLVLGDMLFLHRRDLGIQLTRDGVREDGAYVHVVVMRLLLARHDREGV
jgi:hypothetical protein